MLKRIHFLVLIGALVLSGCGKKEDGGSTASGVGGTTGGSESGKSPEEAPKLKDGWKEIKGQGFSLAVPNDWTPIDLTAANLDAAIEEASKASEAAKAAAGQFKQMASSGMVKIMVFGQVDPAGPFGENLNVVVTDSPAAPSQDQLAEAYKSQMTPLITPGSTPGGGPVDLPVGKGVKMNSELAMATGKITKVASLAYMFHKDSKLYTVTFSSLPGRASDMDKLADEIMQTFKTD